MDWQPIETDPHDGTQVMYRSPGGDFEAPSRPPREPTREQRIAFAKAGVWPDHRKWRPTHWARIERAANDTSP